MSQIKLLLDVISDVRSLGDSLQAYADALTVSDKLEVEGFEQIYPPAEEAQQPEPTNPELSTKPITLTVEKVKKRTTFYKLRHFLKKIPHRIAPMRHFPTLHRPQA